MLTATNKPNPAQDTFDIKTQGSDESHAQINAIFSELRWALPKCKSA